MQPPQGCGYSTHAMPRLTGQLLPCTIRAGQACSTYQACVMVRRQFARCRVCATKPTSASTSRVSDQPQLPWTASMKRRLA